MATMATLFAGAGGMDAGFESAGFVTLWANELDRDAAASWTANRPTAEHAMHAGDIHTFLPGLSALRGQVSVVIGGPPCQGFSVAGKMDADDKRSELIFRFLDAVDAVRPHLFIMENVAALGELARWRDVREQYLSAAASCGYKTSYRTFSVSEYGVPQKRRRTIFCGVRDGSPDALFDAMGAYVCAAPKSREVILSAGVYNSKENPDTCPASITLAKRPVLRKSPYAGMLANGAGRPVDLNGLPPTLPATMGGNKTPIVDQCSLEDPSVRNWFEDYHQGVLEERIMPASVPVPDHLRRLTLREAAAIQTFPAGYKFVGGKSSCYRQIGNAVPTLFARAIALAAQDAYGSQLDPPHACTATSSLRV